MVTGKHGGVFGVSDSDFVRHENHNEFDKIGINNNESPIIDLSNLDIFSDFGLSSSKFFNDEEIPLFVGKKEKRNPASSSSVSDNIIVVVLND